MNASTGRAPRLKVFQARMGFYESVVAASSQKAALEAWGTRQNLFQEGLAGLAEDPKATRAALARPGVVLRRAAGSKADFAEDAAAPAAPAGKDKATDQPRRQRDRSALDAAEKALAKAQREQAAALQDLEAEQERLRQRRATLESEQEAELDRLRKAAAQARRRYQQHPR
jgi:hypothetical protein